MKEVACIGGKGVLGDGDLVDAINTYELEDGRRFAIYQDLDSEGPREWDNVGSLYHWHTRRNLGKFIGANPVIADVLAEYVGEGEIWLPVFIYDHGSAVLSTSAFGCPWDSGQCGIIVAHKEDVRKCLVENATEESIKEALRDEIKVFSAWINGEVYGYRLLEKGQVCAHCRHDPGWEEIDSCWGFIGTTFEEVKRVMIDAAGIEKFTMTEVEG